MHSARSDSSVPLARPLIGAFALLIASVGCHSKPERGPDPIATAPPTMSQAPEPALMSPVPEVPQAAPAAKPDADLAAMAETLLGKNKRAGKVTRPKRAQRRHRRRPRRQVVVVHAAEPEEEIPLPESLSDNAFYAVVGSWRGMKDCLAKTGIERADASGTVSIEFRIRGDGSVKRSRISQTNNAAARRVAGCVNLHARKLRFPRFAGIPVDKEAKFVF